MEAVGHKPYRFLQVHSQLFSYYSSAVTAGSKELAQRSTKAVIIADIKVPHSRQLVRCGQT